MVGAAGGLPTRVSALLGKPAVAPAPRNELIVMGPDAPASLRVAVIGGGIAGLAAAHRIVELDPALRVDAVRGRSPPGRRAGHRPRRGISGRAKRRQLHHHDSLGPQSLPAAWAGRATGANQPGLPADVRGAAGAALPAAGRLPDDGPHAALAAGGHAHPQPAGANSARHWNTSSRRGPVDADESMAAFVRRRLGRETVRPAGRAAGERGLCGRSGETQRVGHAVAASGRWSGSTAA